MQIFDQSGHDVLEGVGLNRDVLNTEHAVIVYASTSIHPSVNETDVLTLRVDGTGVPSAQIQIDLYVALGA